MANRRALLLGVLLVASAGSPARADEAGSRDDLVVEIGSGYVSAAGSLPGGPPSALGRIGGSYGAARRYGDTDLGLVLRGALDYAAAAPERSEGSGYGAFELKQRFGTDVEIGGTVSAAATRQLDERAREYKAVERAAVRISESWSLYGTLQQRLLDYDDFVIGGIRINEDDRDRAVLGAEAGAEYRLGGPWAIRAGLFGETATYERRFDDFGFRRDYAAATPLLGLIYDTPELKGTLQVGYTTRFFRDVDFRPLDGPVASGTLTWRPSERWALTATAQTSFDDPEFFQSRAVRDLRLGASAVYALTAVDKLGLFGSVRLRLFSDLPRQDLVWQVGGEWSRTLSERLAIVGQVSYARRDLPFFALGYDQAIARVTLRYAS